ncbi:MAG: VOC family protein [Rhodothermaceae bacterium]|nr:VOC family protein [Rhodothermaceae bacterium]MXX96792.1 VOC family protein [Rhodothermaceae bacterium]MXZ57489.1 VOC family protein [Rhodothermaceae bacterium]MYB90473.1 VOC family protein [Rhodothermaceae bacterium]MYC04743.1 VOC family protein [Rhodothermaceae bacterium]
MLPIDHIGVAVHDDRVMDSLLKKLANSAPSLPEDIDAQGVRVRFYGDGTKLETLQPLNADSTVARFLSKRGEGLHHIAFRVANAQAQLERMRAAGFQPLTENPIPGANGKLIFFLHPRDTCGILVEFCQPNKQYAVRFESCNELEQRMLSTGHCIPCDETPGHVVSGGPVPEKCRSLVLHNASSKLSRGKPDAPSVPVLISEASSASTHAQALQEQWPKAELIILPENSQLKLLPTALLDFWSSLENG